MKTYLLTDEVQIIGRAGEQGGITIAVDVSAWQEAYPDAVGGIMVTRPGGDRMPLVTSISSGLMLAVLPPECTDRPGRYDYTATWTLAGTIEASQVYQALILSSEIERGVPPERWHGRTPDWAKEIYIKAEQILNGVDAAMQAEQSVLDARDDAQAAQAAAETAQGAAEDAKDDAEAAKAASEEALASITQILDESQDTIAAMQSAADGIEAQKDTMIASIASVAGQGTDTTLTQSSVAADAKAAGDAIGDLKSSITHSDSNINTSADLWKINSDKSYNRIETKAWYREFGYRVILTSSDYLLNVKAFDDYGNLVGYADTTNSDIISQSEGYFVSSQNPIDLTALASQYYLSFIIRKRVNGSNVPATTDDYVGIEIWKSVYEWRSEDDKIKANFVKMVNLFDKDSPLIKVNTYITGSAYASGDGYAASHPIPVEIGNTYKFPHGAGMGSAHRGFYVNDSGTYIEGFNTTIEDGFETFTATRTGYVAVNLGNGGYAETMFCVQNEYPNSFVPYGEKLSEDFLLNDKQIAEVKDTVNPLYGKTAVFDGDSICAANTNNERRGWALRIIDGNGMTGANVGVGGATITQGTQKSGVDRHWISAYIDTIHANYPALDYYIFDGGTNDADLFRTHPEKKGTFDPVDFSGNYDEETFCGAFESLIYKATSYYPSAKIGYIIPPKMGPLDAETGMTGYTAETNRRRSYFDTAIEICKKWGLPYIDLWDGCLMNPSLGAYYSPGTYYADGQHPTAIGYDLFTPMIDAWMKTL